MDGSKQNQGGRQQQKAFEAASYEHDDHEDTKKEVGNNDDRHSSGNLHQQLRLTTPGPTLSARAASDASLELKDWTRYVDTSDRVIDRLMPRSQLVRREDGCGPSSIIKNSQAVADRRKARAWPKTYKTLAHSCPLYDREKHRRKMPHGQSTHL
jgi:hypothetical protein